MTQDPVNIASLIEDLSTNLGRSILSDMGLRSAALRKHLAELLARQPGEPGALLADPVVEATFSWRPSKVNLLDLVPDNLLREELVNALDGAEPELRFPATRKPYEHQLDCWRLLLQDTARSVLVASSTGSGKTECFLIPILEDLARERATVGALEGVRALFLYPLNALINNQRERLRAWCDGLGADMKFCLYNGETPETAPENEQRQAGSELISRDRLRASPAPILVTNSTMLEFMLVRNQDRPIIEKSRGMLRWIVLDEAHTYIGSQAAEMTLLLRRVLHGFDVDPDQVRFVATSATIGDERATEDLKRFLADISGAPSDRVHVVTGHRFVPKLRALAGSPTSDTGNRSAADSLRERLDALKRAGDHRGLPPDPPPTQLRARSEASSTSDAYDALCQDPRARALRERLSRQAATMSELRNIAHVTNEELTALLEKASLARESGEAFLPIRLHLFVRASAGLWACVNDQCKGRVSGDARDWSFGAIFLSSRSRCEHCEYPVFKVLACRQCGRDYLVAEEEFCADTNTRRLTAPVMQETIDEFLLEPEDPDWDDVEDATSEAALISRNRRLILGAHAGGHAPSDVLLKDSSLHSGANDEGAAITLSPSEENELRCTSCTGQGRGIRGFRDLRVGAPYALSTIVPTALEHTPPIQQGHELPSQGKRLLGFSDSRQGSARLAVRLQQEAERVHVRSILYHVLADHRTIPNPREIDELEGQVAALGTLCESSPQIRPVYEEKKKKLANLKAASQLGSLSWREAVETLSSNSSVRQMCTQFRETTHIGSSPIEFAQFCLYREFLRRPMRMNSAETMGLICLRYPNLESCNPPESWPLSRSDWPIFLKLIVDFFVRGVSAVAFDNKFLRWMGIPIRQRFLRGPSHQGGLSRFQTRWPAIRPDIPESRQPRLARLLRTAAQLDYGNESNDRINESFKSAWEDLRSLFQQAGDGYQFRPGQGCDIE